MRIRNPRSRPKTGSSNGLFRNRPERLKSAFYHYPFRRDDNRHTALVRRGGKSLGGARTQSSSPFTLAARLRPWLAIGAGGALELYPAHAGRNNISFNPIAETAGAGGYFGPALVFLSPKVVNGEVVVGLGGGGVNKVWGGVGLVVAPSLMFDVWSRGWSHLSIDLRAVYGQWAFPDNSAVRPFLGALAGVSYTFH